MQRKAAVCLLLAGTALFGQQEARKTFEAASVKLDTSGGTANRTNNTLGQVMMTNTPLDRVGFPIDTTCGKVQCRCLASNG